MSLEILNKKIADKGYNDVVIFNNPDYIDACIGVSYDGRAVYDYTKMIECLIKEDGISDIEAMEFIDYNTIRALPYFESFGNGAPIIVYESFDDDLEEYQLSIDDLEIDMFEEE